MLTVLMIFMMMMMLMMLMLMMMIRARGPDWQPHPLLEQLSLGGYCTDGRLAWLLGGCPRLRSLHLDGELWTTHHEIQLLSQQYPGR